MYIQSLRSIRDIHLSGVTEECFHEIIPLENFEGTSCTGKVSLCIFHLCECYFDYLNLDLHWRSTSQSPLNF